MNDFHSTGRTRSSARPILIALAAAFAIGAAAAGYGVARFGAQLGIAPQPAPSSQAVAGIGSTPAAPTMASPSPDATASQAAHEAVKAAQIVAQQQGGLDERLAAAEQRIARLDIQSQAAAGNAARAEGLLIAFSARRALERGAELGFIGDQLRLRFGDAMPNAVDTVIAFSRRPVTLDQLVAGLDRLAPDLAQGSERLSWARVQDEFASLFTVRRENMPSPQPTRRLERARLFLQSGRVDAAVAEVQRLPGAGKAATWMADAKRFQAAQGALDLLETAAVLEPRRLRDGTGQKIEQASPAIAPADGMRSGAQ